jgi:hypothetical protein
MLKPSYGKTVSVWLLELEKCCRASATVFSSRKAGCLTLSGYRVAATDSLIARRLLTIALGIVGTVVETMFKRRG